MLMNMLFANNTMGSQTSDDVLVIGRMILTIFCEEPVRQIFVEYGVNPEEILEDVLEAIFQNDEDTLFRILKQILEIELGAENNEEDYATSEEYEELSEDYEIDSEREEEMFGLGFYSDEPNDDTNDQGEYQRLVEIYERLGPVLSSRLINLLNTDGDPQSTVDFEIMNKLEKRMVNQELLDKADKCVICLDSFKKDEEVNILRCEHLYHCACLKTWLEMHPTCPMCRGNP